MAGELMIDNGKLSGGRFEIDFKSITVLDLKDEEMNKKLTGHLKSEDFFSADKHPVGAFEITGVTENGSNYTIKGNMTIKGITKEISFPANLKVENNKATAEASIELDRTEWDIKYGSGKFFENLGDKMIYDKFNLTIKLSAES
jgi:polyisoprenoid-binding protein YceI